MRKAATLSQQPKQKVSANTKPKKKEQITYVIQQPPQQQHYIPNNNASTATFSSLAKQAESLVNGDISITFSNYNNNILFKSKHVETNECVNIDVIHKKLQKINAISFENNSELKGISDGYTTNKQGSKIPLYDKNIALSTVFAYEYQHKIDSVRRDLNNEIEKRKNADDLLNKRVDVVEQDIDKLEKEVSDLKSTISTMDSQIKSLQSDLSTAKSDIKTLTSTCAAQETRIQQLEALTKHFVMAATK